MVSLNFTFFVILAFFLVFLWAMNRFVIQPLLVVMDQRDGRIQGDKEEARKLTADAAAREREYASRLSALHQEAQLHIAQAHRTAQESYQAGLEALKQREAEEVRDARAEARRLIAEQRDQYDALAAELKDLLRAQLGREKPAS